MEIKLNHQWKSQQLRKLFIATIIIWVLFAILFAFTDLQISIALVDYNSQWTQVISTYGEIPGYLLVSISLTLMIRNQMINSKWKTNLWFWITNLFSILVTVLLLGDLLPESIMEDSGEVIIILIYIIGQYLMIHLTKDNEYLSEQKTLIFARVTYYLALIIPLLYVQTVKTLWGRVRFRDLALEYNNFSPWFQPRGITGNLSFPSGHTAMGWLLLPILILVANKEGWIYRSITIVILIWGCIVALGRIVIGAHYASDVLFSTGATIIVFSLLYNKFYYEITNKDIS